MCCTNQPRVVTTLTLIALISHNIKTICLTRYMYLSRHRVSGSFVLSRGLLILCSISGSVTFRECMIALRSLVSGSWVKVLGSWMVYEAQQGEIMLLSQVWPSNRSHVPFRGCTWSVVLFWWVLHVKATSILLTSFLLFTSIVISFKGWVKRLKYKQTVITHCT